jgi:transcriptional regulator with XRE-family HTH domain
VTDSTFGSRLRKIRKDRGLSQMQLAVKLGMESLTSIRNWEARGVVPSGTTVGELAQILQVSSDYLLGLVPDATLSRGLEAGLEDLGDALADARPEQRNGEAPPQGASEDRPDEQGHAA